MCLLEHKQDTVCSQILLFRSITQFQTYPLPKANQNIQRVCKTKLRLCFVNGSYHTQFVLLNREQALSNHLKCHQTKEGSVPMPAITVV
jgi:hypothetical protein